MRDRKRHKNKMNPRFTKCLRDRVFYYKSNGSNEVGC